MARDFNCPSNCPAGFCFYAAEIDSFRTDLSFETLVDVPVDGEKLQQMRTIIPNCGFLKHLVDTTTDLLES